MVSKNNIINRNIKKLTGNVLLVEDNWTNVKVASALLKKFGLDVTVAVNGKEALDFVCKNDGQYDLVLMDLRMPIMGGVEATQMIRGWEDQNDLARLPIVAQTADLFPEVIHEAKVAGMDGFIAKPIDSGELYDLVAQYVG